MLWRLGATSVLAQIGPNFGQLTLGAMSEGGPKGSLISQLCPNRVHSSVKTIEPKCRDETPPRSYVDYVDPVVVRQSVDFSDASTIMRLYTLLYLLENGSYVNEKQAKNLIWNINQQSGGGGRGKEIVVSLCNDAKIWNLVLLNITGLLLRSRFSHTCTLLESFSR